MKKISDRLWNWASHIEDNTLAQAEMLSRLPIIDGHVALMPDAHLGIGSTVGSVIPTKGAVIPAAVGVDIGCGMIASRTDLKAPGLPDDLGPFVSALETVVPAGLGKWHDKVTPEAAFWMRKNPNERLTDKLLDKATLQLGTMGSGNHFFEVCLDQSDAVWIIMHSGSRGVGNQLANAHIKVARALCAEEGIPLEDPDLAYLQERTPAFDAYIADMLWAQDYAKENRQQMMAAALAAFFEFVGHGQEDIRVNCHHNFTTLEQHDGRDVWVTRKGAIRAGVHDLALIPGSMGTKSYVVKGRGNPDSYQSCAHGAGRRMSRGQARRTFTTADLTERMAGRAWQSKDAEKLLDEHPDSYKDIDQVMRDQADLVEVLYELRGIANYKGVEEQRRKGRRGPPQVAAGENPLSGATDISQGRELTPERGLKNEASAHAYPADPSTVS